MERTSAAERTKAQQQLIKANLDINHQMVERNNGTIDQLRKAGGPPVLETLLHDSNRLLTKSEQLFSSGKFEEGQKFQKEGMKLRDKAHEQAKKYFMDAITASQSESRSLERREAVLTSIAKGFNIFSYFGAHDAVLYTYEKISPGTLDSIRTSGISDVEKIPFYMAALSGISVVPVGRGVAATQKLTAWLGPTAVEFGEIVLKTKAFQLAEKMFEKGALVIAENVPKGMAATAKFVYYIGQQFQKIPAKLEVIEAAANEIGQAITKYPKCAALIDEITKGITIIVNKGGTLGAEMLGELKESLSMFNKIGNLIDPKATLWTIRNGKLWDSFANLFGKGFKIIDVGKPSLGTMTFNVFSKGNRYAVRVSLLGKALPLQPGWQGVKSGKLYFAWTKMK